jgi:3-methyladenine DNA glycosylase AlkD
MPTLRSLLRARLAAVAEPARAPAMQAYMKSAMPYLGVSAVPLHQVCKTLFSESSFPSAKAWRGDVLALWRGAKFREERYAAIELTGVRAVTSTGTPQP